MAKKTLNTKPFLLFVLSYTLLFYFLGHLDAMHSLELSDDFYFGFLTLVGLFIFLSLLAAYRLVESNSMTFKKFAIFTGFATFILPISVWGLAWISWFSIKSGNLILWKIGAIKIAIPWSIFIPFHLATTLIFVVVVGYVTYHKLKL
ncbi:hypothetical protein HOD83_03200 [Candidatus Woesearchaeota archaeon]|nr:hypothetical protein [Candidatus Woesearchaeota archaeon]MBT4114370.1 hypothetical protein [Candidatus Woesearchaeota archaeon]MBT4248565.1 hypothetical protein [Candidatus Woesearchaeota archaeon]